MNTSDKTCLFPHNSGMIIEGDCHDRLILRFPGP